VLRFVPLAIILIALPAAAQPAPAGDVASRARYLAMAADALARSGDYEEAIIGFKEAYALDPRVEYRCNVGIAYYRAGDLPRAHLFLGLCLERGADLPAAFTDQARRVLASVEDRLRHGDFTPIEVLVTPLSATIRVSSFARDETFEGWRRIWLPFGGHALEASAPGFQRRVVVVAAVERESQTVNVVLEPNPPEPAPPAEPAAEREPAPEPEPPPPAPTDAHRFRIPQPVQVARPAEPRPAFRKRAGTAAAITVVSAIAAVTLHLGNQDSKFETGAVTVAAYAMDGAAVISAGVCGYYWLRHVTTPSRTAVGASVAPGGAMLTLSGSF